ncbi:hypothetical protein OF83DRAFT_1087394 [Amylostereum chailletii]|nr:hypothetical protein OF83DRAFT_1087394 [Amylostereum chailletii]
MTILTTPAPRKKLQGYEFYRQVLGSPKHVVAPMVDQSELAWRTLSRRYGAQLVYTPMINAKFGEEGGPADRPLIVQFCANDPDKLLAAAKALEPHCDAVDINLGCPQDIAKRGHYGAFLQDDWDLIYNLIHTLHENLSVPVTAKFRVFPTVEKTVAYAQMLERAGAQILACHGRLREQRGQNAGLADWDKIRAVKQAVSVPVFANGNILFHSDIARCLEATGADAVMSAEGQLYNAALFAPAAPLPPLSSSSSSSSSSPSSSSSSASTTASPSTPPTPSNLLTAPYDTGLHPRLAALAHEYLTIVSSQKTPTSPSAIKGHLFKTLLPALAVHTDLRARLGRVSGTLGDMLPVCFAIVREVEERVEADERRAVEEGRVWEEEKSVVEGTGVKKLPHWLAQPYVRPPPKAKAAPAEGEYRAATAKTQAPAGEKRARSERTPELEGGEDELKRARVEADVPPEATPGVVYG